MGITEHMKQLDDTIAEYVEMIGAWREEDNSVPKPELDEGDFQLVQEELEIALKRKCKIQIQTWKNGKLLDHKGIIENTDFKNNRLIYSDSLKEYQIPVCEIVSITMME